MIVSSVLWFTDAGILPTTRSNTNIIRDYRQIRWSQVLQNKHVIFVLCSVHGILSVIIFGCTSWNSDLISIIWCWMFVWKCVECNKFICNRCKDIHLNVQTNIQHQIIDIKSLFQDVQPKIITDNISRLRSFKFIQFFRDNFFYRFKVVFVVFIWNTICTHKMITGSTE
jgi:hypothetical protein